jgi:DNA processing protein
MTQEFDAELRALIALHLVPGLGPRLTMALLEHFGSAQNVLEAPASELRQVPYLGGALAETLAETAREAEVDAEIARIEKHDVQLLALGRPGYPPFLAEIHNPPHLLYTRGTIEERDQRAVAIVGTRQCTDYGKRTAQRLAADLARAGCTIVSGLARGIDGQAHRGALAAGGRTIAVLANNLTRIYPPEHKDLAAQVQQSGAVLSEAAMNQDLQAGMFPSRNRIISGLARAVIIVEAAEKSGALITAEHANEQGRTVFAVPGPVDAAASSGCNALIREGAILCRSAADVLEELDGVAAVAAGKTPAAEAVASAPAPPPTPAGLDDVQKRVWEFLAGATRHMDEMVQQLRLGVPQLTGTLLTLEMKRLVRRLPGNRYERM